MPAPAPLRCAASFLLAMLLAGLVAGCKQDSDETTSMEPPAVTVARPVQRQVTDWDEFTGRFVPVERVDIRARVSGYVDSVEFTDGQLVRRGDVLYRIDPRPLQAAVAEAQGRLAEAQSRVALADRELARANELLRYRATSEAATEQRTQGAQGARAQVATAQAELQRAQLDLEFATVRAPQDGRIGRHLVSPGNLVSGGEAGATLLATIVTVDPIDLSFDIDQAAFLRYARLAETGQRPSSRDNRNPVELALEDERDYPHHGQVVFVDNEADLGTGTLRLRARFANPGGQLFIPGVFARVRLLGSAPYQALLLPDAAIATDQSRRVVYVLGAENKVAMREVRPGPLQPDGLRVIRSGLQAGDEVVVRGMPRVRVGAPVTPERLPPGSPMAVSD